MTESPQPIEIQVIEPLVIEPQALDSTATDFIGIIQDELEELETNFHLTLNYLDGLIDLENIDFEENEAEFLAKAEDLNSEVDHKKASFSLLRVSKCEDDFEELYTKQLSQLETVTSESLDAYRKNFEAIYDETIKNEELKQLEKSSAKVTDIDIDDKEELQYNIDFNNPLEANDTNVNDEGDQNKEKSDENESNKQISETDKLNIALFKNKEFNKLSENDIYRLLRIEKLKRAKLSYTNENQFKPEIGILKREFEKWVSYDSELQRFFNRDIPDMNKKIQSVKKREKL